MLLGQDNGKTVNVANSFAVPFEEDEKDSKTWFLDHNYIENMWEMFKKVNGTFIRYLLVVLEILKSCRSLLARERMIGWYHTGPKLRASDLEINELFKRFIPKPVMVIVDVRPQTVGIPTDAYFAVEEIKDVSNPSYAPLLELTPPDRTGQRPGRRSCMYQRPSKQKRRKKSASSIFYEI